MGERGAVGPVSSRSRALTKQPPSILTGVLILEMERGTPMSALTVTEDTVNQVSEPDCAIIGEPPAPRQPPEQRQALFFHQQKRGEPALPSLTLTFTGTRGRDGLGYRLLGTWGLSG